MKTRRLAATLAVGLLALMAMTPTAQANPCVGIIIHTDLLDAQQQESESSDSPPTTDACVGIPADEIPEELDPAITIASDTVVLVRDAAFDAADDAPGVEPPVCTEQPPLLMPAACVAWVLSRIDPTITWATSTEEGAESMPNWLGDAGTYSVDASVWGNDYATYITDYAHEDVVDGATDYSVDEAFAQAGYGLGRATAASSHAAQQATLLAAWVDHAQSELTTYVQRESNGLASHERAFLEEVDAFLHDTADDLRAYAVALESWGICRLGHTAEFCGPQPEPSPLRTLPTHEDYQRGADPDVGTPTVLDPLVLYVEPSVGDYTPPDAPDLPGPGSEFPTPPGPPLDE